MNHEQTVAWWLDKAPTYFTDMVFSFSRPDLIGRLKLTQDSPVLELGFGYGRELSQFCRISANVYGLELSPVTCDIARKQLSAQGIDPLRYALGTYDGLHLPFPDGKFALVYSCFVLQHMSKADARTLLAECLRVTRKGGNVLMEWFGDPAFHNPGGDAFSGNPEDGTGMFNNAYTKAEVEAICGSLGKLNWIEPTNIGPFDNHWSCISPC